MIKILVISDTHGYLSSTEKLLAENKFDAIIHAGDCVPDAEYLEAVYPHIPIYYVAGNNDFYSRADNDSTFIIGGVKFFLTHGHGYRVKYESDFRTLCARARSIGANVAVFGHTHMPYLAEEDGLTVLNPGSIGFYDTYACVEVENGKAKVTMFK